MLCQNRTGKEYTDQLGNGMCVCVCVCSVVSDFATPWTIVCQVLLSMEFSRQEYWNGLPFPPPGDLPDLGIEPASLASLELSGRFFTTLLPARKWDGLF